jgi:hypothetical protein
MADARRPKQMFASMSESEVAELHEEMVDMGLLK